MRRMLVAFLLVLGIGVYAQDLGSIPAGQSRIIVFAEYWTPLWNGLKTPAQITLDQTNLYEILPISNFLVFDVPAGRHVVAGSWKAALAPDPDVDGVSFYLGEGKTLTLKFKIYNGSAQFIAQPGEPAAGSLAKLTPLSIKDLGGKK